MGDLSIGEIADRAGIKASAIRYYESVDLLPKPPRRSGQRQYDKSVLDRLKLIELAKSLDFTLDEIRVFFDGLSEKSPPGQIWRAFANTKLEIIEAQIARAEQLRKILLLGLECKCLKLSDCKLPEV